MKYLALDYWMNKRPSPLEKDAYYYERNYPYLGETSLKNGCYLDGKDCFFVVEGKKYLFHVDAFKYNLKLLVGMENVGSVEKLKELAAAEKKYLGSYREDTRDRLYALFTHQSVRHIKKRTVRMRKAMAKLKKERAK